MYSSRHNSLLSRNTKQEAWTHLNRAKLCATIVTVDDIESASDGHWVGHNLQQTSSVADREPSVKGPQREEIRDQGWKAQPHLSVLWLLAYLLPTQPISAPTT